MSDYALSLIRRIRSARHADVSRLDVLSLCQELEARLNVSPRIPKKPAPELRAINPKRYMRLYMRWWRWLGQAGEGGTA